MDKPAHLKEVQPIDKTKTPQNDPKTQHVVETAQLAVRAHNLRKEIEKIQKELTEIDKRTGELAFILMTMEQMEKQNGASDTGQNDDKRNE